MGTTDSKTSTVSLKSPPTERVLIPLYNECNVTDDFGLILYNICFNIYKSKLKGLLHNDDIFVESSDIIGWVDRLVLIRFIRENGNPNLANMIMDRIQIHDTYDNVIDLISNKLNVIDIIWIQYGPNATIRNTYPKLLNDILQSIYPEERCNDSPEERLIIKMGENNPEQVFDTIIRNDIFSENIVLMNMVERLNVTSYGWSPICRLANRYLSTTYHLIRKLIKLWGTKISDSEYSYLLDSAMGHKCTERIQILLEGISSDFDFSHAIQSAISWRFYDALHILLLNNQHIIDPDLYFYWIHIIQRTGNESDRSIIQLLEERKSILLEGIGG